MQEEPFSGLLPAELHEEFAWGYIAKHGWAATPLLLMWLVRLVSEADINSPEKLAGKIARKN